MVITYSSFTIHFELSTSNYCYVTTLPPTLSCSCIASTLKALASGISGVSN